MRQVSKKDPRRIEEVSVVRLKIQVVYRIRWIELDRTGSWLLDPEKTGVFVYRASRLPVTKDNVPAYESVEHLRNYHLSIFGLRLHSNTFTIHAIEVAEIRYSANSFQTNDPLRVSYIYMYIPIRLQQRRILIIKYQ